MSTKKVPMSIHNLRLPHDTDERADGLIEYLQGEMPELGTVSRAAVIRVATLRGLAAMERDRDKAAREAVPAAPVSAPGKRRK